MRLHVDWGLSHLGWASLVAQLQTAGLQVCRSARWQDLGMLTSPFPLALTWMPSPVPLLHLGSADDI